MKTILSPRKRYYMRSVSIFLIVVALVAGIVSCNGVTKYDLTMAENPAAGGTATDETSGSPYAEGADVSIKAVPNTGYEFVGWTAPAGSFADEDARETTFTMPAQDVTVTANFALVYDLTMAENPATGGTATDETGTSPYPAGTSVDIKAVPAAGYQFVEWTAPAGSFADSNAATTTFTMPAEDVTATAHFVGPLDHFKCYETGAATNMWTEVYLEDQFVAINATVGSAELFCNPTEKMHDDMTTPMSNPDHHLMIYDFISYDGEPVTEYVEVDNQFGLEELMVQGPVALAVPTQKEGHEAPLLLDHYLLYQVIGGSLVGEIVILNDQFSSEPDALVMQPLLLGNPVRKTHDGEVTEIINTDDHLLFYYIYVEEGFTTQVQIDNQFEEGTLDVREPSFLAVPSTKTELPAPPPLDHFKGYTLVEPIPAEPNDLYLEDQFSAFWAEATLAWEFCNPVIKWHEGVPSELFYPDNHLMLYDILYEEELPSWDVNVHNQFGEQFLEVGSPVKLAVPTWKIEPPGHGPPMDLDHFLLYEVVWGEPIEVPVILDDQFMMGEEVLVLEPAFFANPVQKTHGDVTTPILNPWGHLVFYRIIGSENIVPIMIDNQFTAGYLSWTWESNYLVVPTEKWSYYPWL